MPSASTSKRVPRLSGSGLRAFKVEPSQALKDRVGVVGRSEPFWPCLYLCLNLGFNVTLLILLRTTSAVTASKLNCAVQKRPLYH